MSEEARASDFAQSMEASNLIDTHLKKSRKNSSTKEKTLDRISILPDSVILHILSFLTATYAIRTSILSKRWQFLWTFVPVLELDDDFILNGPGNPRYVVSFISNTLMLHQSPKLKKLVLRLYYVKKLAPNIDRWLRFATRKNVEELELDFSSLGNDILGGDVDSEDEIEYKIPECYVVPSSVLNNSCLVSLKLALCDLQYGRLISWRSLKFLSLSKMVLCNDLIGDILCGSPLLEFLELCECKDFDFLDIKSERMRKLVLNCYGNLYDPPSEAALKIVAPNIKSLRISGSLNTMKLLLTNSSSLVDVHLDFQLQKGEEVNHLEYAKNVLELLQNLRHVKYLAVGVRCLEALALLEMEILPFSPSKLECLRVHTYLSRKEQFGIVKLLSLFGRGYVSLTLVISIIYPRHMPSEDDDVENYLTALRKNFAATLERIKTVKFVNFSVQERETQFILFLLKNARHLEKMIIHTHPDGSKTFDLKKSLEAAQLILCTPRCSGNALVLFS